MPMPAARVNDPTTNGGLISPLGGCPTVLIGKQAAARVGDLVTGPSPPPPPPPLISPMGSRMVFIEKLPAARVGDMTPFGTIAQGCPSVLIGP